MSDIASPRSAGSIYRDLDRAALDAAYNNSAAVVDSAERISNWTRRSAVFRAATGARLDVSYGRRPRALLDYLPSGLPRSPLFVFIHGGYWQRNTKEIFAFVSEGPRASGFDVAVLGYSLAPVVRLTEIVEEIECALTFLDDHANEFGFRRNSIYVGGWSAGGHLTAIACWHPAVRGGVAISGIFDLEPIAASYINEKLRLDRAEITLLSPIRRLHISAAPMRLAVGANELPELQRQSQAFASAAERYGREVSLRILQSHDHFSILEELADPDGVLTQELLALAQAP